MLSKHRLDQSFKALVKRSYFSLWHLETPVGVKSFTTCWRLGHDCSHSSRDLLYETSRWTVISSSELKGHAVANKTLWILTYNLLLHFPSRSNKTKFHHQGHFIILSSELRQCVWADQGFLHCGLHQAGNSAPPHKALPRPISRLGPGTWALAFIYTMLPQTPWKWASGLYLRACTFSFVPGSRCKETLNSE